MKKLKRLFQIKTKFEVFLITYALGLGACERGFVYMQQYPGKIGYVFFALCTGSVFLASAKMLEAVELQRMFGVD
jgi:predicted metal-binding protein